MSGGNVQLVWVPPQHIDQCVQDVLQRTSLHCAEGVRIDRATRSQVLHDGGERQREDRFFGGGGAGVDHQCVADRCHPVLLACALLAIKTSAGDVRHDEIPAGEDHSNISETTGTAEDNTKRDGKIKNINLCGPEINSNFFTEAPLEAEWNYYDSIACLAGVSDWDDARRQVCDMLGITCDADGNVVEIKLKNRGLEGQLLGKIGFLSLLEKLGVSNNNFMGYVPSDLKCGRP